MDAMHSSSLSTPRQATNERFRDFDEACAELGLAPTTFSKNLIARLFQQSVRKVSKYGIIGALGGAIAGSVLDTFPGVVKCTMIGSSIGVTTGIGRVVDKCLTIAGWQNLSIVKIARVGCYIMAFGCTHVGVELSNSLTRRCSWPWAEIGPCAAITAASNAMFGLGLGLAMDACLTVTRSWTF